MSSGYTVDANRTNSNPSMTRQLDDRKEQVRVGVDGMGIPASREQMYADERAQNQMTSRETGGRSKKRSRRTKKRKNTKTKKSRRRRRRTRK